MKITKIESEGNIYSVTFSPNWLEALLGVREKTKRFKRTFSFYEFGGQSVYRNEDGTQRGNNDWISEAIDKHIRKF